MNHISLIFEIETVEELTMLSISKTRERNLLIKLREKKMVLFNSTGAPQ